MVPSPGNKVWGALYEVPDFLIERKPAEAQVRKSLDAIEGEGASYRCEAIAVRRKNGSVATEITCRVRNPVQGPRTRLKYAGYIIKGLRERGVCEDYIDGVKKLAQARIPAITVDIQEL